MQPVYATDLNDAWCQAYKSSPQILAMRQQLHATNEKAAQAFSGWFPAVTASAQRGPQQTKIAQETIDSTTDQKSISLTQPLFSGGKTYYSQKQADDVIFAKRFELKALEQDVFLETVRAYMGVITAEQILSLNKYNNHVAQQYLDATVQRTALGQLTSTDLAQSQANQALAESELIKAEGGLATAGAYYQRVIGNAPQGLSGPTTLPDLSVLSLDEMITIAAANHPDILKSNHLEQAGEHDVNIEKSNLFPRLDLVGHHTEQSSNSFFGDYKEKAIKLNISVPLYQNGSEYSRIRQAKYKQKENTLNSQEVKQRITFQMIEAYHQYHTTKSSLVAQQLAIQAFEKALSGTKKEESAGARTTLDVLEAEQDLFLAKTQHITLKSEHVLHSYQLLSGMGRLNIDYLKLDIDQYNPDQHYQKAKRTFFSTAID